MGPSRVRGSTMKHLDPKPGGARNARAVACTIAALAGFASLAVAQPGAPPRPQPQVAPRPPWHGDIRSFHQHDWPVWRTGRWVHGRHDGRLGWWWVVGSLWYFHPWPVYPYPNPYEPPPAWAVPPAGTAPPAPVTPYWYYCEGARGYYPYVSTCAEGWKPVPATPPDLASAPAR